MSEEAILLRQDKGQRVDLTLNRPGQFNSLSEDMLAALQKELDAIAADPRIMVVVLHGNGKAFCAGHDLKEMRANPQEAYYRDLFERCSGVMQTINRMPQIVIASVHGIATAAGCQLVAQADLAVCSEAARFAVSGITVGLFCSTPAVPLSRVVPRKKAMEMLVTGDFIDAEDARQNGLVNRVVPAEQLDSEVDALCDKVMSRSTSAIRRGKALFYAQLDKPLDEAYQLAGSVMACNMMDEDAAEGIDAFMQKRQPQYRGKE
ncbi:enoyl-CoA hydratase [Granulosicoccaceae sp. 1_MG-2023]|nr:enoyl-CoA hydratase [Granulosicoccaceae sp. 1_MG-2023]